VKRGEERLEWVTGKQTLKSNYMRYYSIPAPIRDIFHYALRMKNPQGERGIIFFSLQGNLFVFSQIELAL
jgi:hypothetical protein